MSLNEEFGDEIADNAPSDEPTPKVEWDEAGGTIQTGAKDSSFNPSDFSAVLKEFGEDPETTRLELIGGTKWLQSRRVASRQTNDGWVREFEDKWLYAYRYRFTRNAFIVNLPALYSEVAQTQPQKLPENTRDAAVVVCWSDVQTGKVDRLGGLKELLARLDSTRQSLKTYLDNAQPSQVVVADCGDIIEGFQNFDAQTRTNALSIMDQVDVAATELWKTIKLCASYAPVDVLSIPSNHCRWAKGKSLIGKTTDDWGLHVNKRLERMNTEVGLPVTFHRSQEWEETLQFDIRGTRLGLAHGHQANNPDQIKNWWAKMTHAGVLDCQILVTGHFHFPSLRPSGKTPEGRSKWHVQASTIDNGSSWVRNKYGEDGDPALTVFQINDGGFDVSSFTLL